MYKIIFVTQFSCIPFITNTKENAFIVINAFQKALEDLKPGQDKMFFADDDDKNKVAMVRLGSVIGFYVLEQDASESWRN